MINLEKFAYAGMLSCRKPSTNRVGYFSPTTLRSTVEAGSATIQSSVTLESGSYLCTNNTGIIIGDINPNSGHTHPGRLVVEKNAWVGHIGDQGGVILTIGKHDDGVLIINNGKGLFEKGNIINPSAHIATVKINEGVLVTNTLHMENALSTLAVRNGLVRLQTASGLFSTIVYSGLLSISSAARAGEIRLTGTGACLFGIDSPSIGSSSIGPNGFNFIGDGGALIVRLYETDSSLTATYEAEAFFDNLMKENKIKRDDETVHSFVGFKMSKLIGHDKHCYAVLRPVPLKVSRKIIPEMVKNFLCGEIKQTYGL